MLGLTIGGLQAGLAQAQPAFVDGGAPPATANRNEVAPQSETLKQDYAQTPIPLEIILPQVTPAETAGVTQQAPAKLPVTVGVGRDVPTEYQEELKAGWHWQDAPDGGQTTVFTVTSPGALSIRIALITADMTEGIELRFFGTASPERVFGPYTVKDLVDDTAGGLFWSPVVEGETIGVEIYRPASHLSDDFLIAVPKVSHLLYSARHSSLKDLSGIGRSAACNIDVQCRNTTPVALEAAIAKIIFTSDDGGSFLCSGTLINDADPASYIPYFLTANHCVSTHLEVQTINSFWFFERAGCGGANPTSVIQFTGGGELLSTGVTTDYTFLQLEDQDLVALPNIWFAGWHSSPLPENQSIIGLHHPSGDLKKWSSGTAVGFADYGDNVNGTGAFIQVIWSQGTTEGGSSGSGIFDTSGRLRGTLTGGAASCAAPTQPDWYGRFDLAYPDIQSWLNGATLLSAGTPTTSTVLTNEWQDFKVTLVASQTQFTVTLNGLSQDADLYVRKSTRPTRRSYDCRPLLSGASSETCVISNNGNHTYFISVRGPTAGATPFNLLMNVTQAQSSGGSQMATFRSGVWFLDSNGSRSWNGCGVDTCVGFGGANDIAIAGNW